MAGLAVLGRDRFGIFPLRGKLLNVRDVSAATALASAEIAAIVSILGLDVRCSYAGVPAEKRGLRYGRVMIMADQDVDGSHIKGACLFGVVVLTVQYGNSTCIPRHRSNYQHDPHVLARSP